MKILALIVFLVGFLLFWRFRSGETTKPAIPVLPQTDSLRAPDVSDKIRGLTFVAPPEPFSDDPMKPISDVGANWIAVVPYGFTPPNKAVVRYDVKGMHWWGEKPEGVRETINRAKAAGLHLMLKPQIYIPGGWTGSLDFETEDQWESWEKDYEKYIIPMAELAQQNGVELFCIGTEFRTAIAKRPEFWHALIAKIRKIYSGKLTYSANWDDWEAVPFYKELDFIGLGGYFPLVNAPCASAEQLQQAWQPIMERLRAFSNQQGKPVLFTEYGYLTVEGASWKNWELEPVINDLPINQQAQANCLRGLWTNLGSEPWWAGGFLWKWFPNMRGHEGYPERDYTPQGKIAEETLRSIWKQ